MRIVPFAGHFGALAKIRRPIGLLLNVFNGHSILDVLSACAGSLVPFTKTSPVNGPSTRSPKNWLSPIGLLLRIIRTFHLHQSKSQNAQAYLLAEFIRASRVTEFDFTEVSAF
jgi:hypothetical protein